MTALATPDRAFGAAMPQIQRYANLLTGPGIERGLLGPREAPRLWERHLLNCAAIAELLPARGTVVDVGSGAGLPGVVLAAMRPDLRMVLIEPLLRRVAFLEQCREDLGLTSMEVCRARAEEVAGDLVADAVTARAVAPLARLLGWCYPLLTPGGTMLAIKGDRAEQEVAAAAPLARRLGVQSIDIVACRPPWLPDAVTVVVVTAGSSRGGRA